MSDVLTPEWAARVRWLLERAGTSFRLRAIVNGVYEPMASGLVDEDHSNAPGISCQDPTTAALVVEALRVLPEVLDIAATSAEAFAAAARINRTHEEHETRIARLEERLAFAQAELDVRSGKSCEEERAEGNGGCGMCAWCCQSLRDRLLALEIKLAGKRRAARRLGAQLDLTRDQRDIARANAACDACAGQGGNPGCMCGGTGLASDAVCYLRSKLLEAGPIDQAAAPGGGPTRHAFNYLQHSSDPDARAMAISYCSYEEECSGSGKHGLLGPSNPQVNCPSCLAAYAKDKAALKAELALEKAP